MYPRMMRYAISLLGDGEAAHDIVAEMFEKTWLLHERQPDAFTSKMGNWAYATVHHACLNHLKHLQVEYANERELAASALYGSTEDYWEHERMLRQVEEAIETLGEPTGTILRLCALKRYTYQQASEIMGVSIHTIKKHVTKAYTLLRQQLSMNKERKE